MKKRREKRKEKREKIKRQGNKERRGKEKNITKTYNWCESKRNLMLLIGIVHHQYSQESYN
jgi:hypothetical protein